MPRLSSYEHAGILASGISHSNSFLSTKSQVLSSLSLEGSQTGSSNSSWATRVKGHGLAGVAASVLRHSHEPAAAQCCPSAAARSAQGATQHRPVRYSPTLQPSSRISHVSATLVLWSCHRHQNCGGDAQL